MVDRDEMCENSNILQGLITQLHNAVKQGVMCLEQK